MTGIYSHKLLAFICAVKRFRSNSIILGHERKYLIAKSIDIAPETYSKYLRDCISLGLVYHMYGKYYFVGLSKTIEILFDDLKTWKYRRFYQEFNHVTFNEFYNAIEISILKQNIDRQYHKKTHRTKFRKNEVINISGVSGKVHLSKLLDCSVSTGSRRLRKWNNTNQLERTVIYQPWELKVHPMSNVREFHRDMVCIGKQIYQVRGSKIRFNAL